MTFRIETTAEAERHAEAILDWLLSEHAGETGALVSGTQIRDRVFSGVSKTLSAYS